MYSINSWVFHKPRKRSVDDVVVSIFHCGEVNTLNLIERIIKAMDLRVKLGHTLQSLRDRLLFF